MEAKELVMQCAMAIKKTQSKAKLALSNIGIWNKTHQECARPTQTQMGMSVKHMSDADIQNLQGSKCKDQCQFKA